ncbi:hypothetical protein ELE36_19230 [Pseudolysobacter antarcticus]|uniref:Uncharacterized protein n=1 Tax=Pseudolysobacter antarcticus TaxID=2511995 RepID=A0A411HPA0_9GAMM|nr:hypothetical protein [Pseudolysobacter antarcticus]QBB72329.1 hypothetical protein ELE36_19230 [Pseudolysobacter antarcticus]
MFIADAQREVRSVYMLGSVGQVVSGLVWAVSAALTTWYSTSSGILAMLLGGFFIYPATQLVLRATGSPASLPATNPMRELAIEVAVVGPLMLPLIGAATLYKNAWFYPAFMVAIGAHYLPFSFLYGMRQFIILAAIMMASGLLVGLYAPSVSTLGAWFTAALLLTFGLVHWRIHAAQQSKRA